MSQNSGAGEDPIKSEVTLGNILDPTIVVTPPSTQTVDPPVDPLINQPAVLPTTPTTPTNDAVDLESFTGLVNAFSQENLTVEAQTIKDALLQTFKAKDINNGNLVNDKGEVILSAAKLQAYIDNDVLPLDKEGNIVNDKGEILHTRAEVLNAHSLINPIKEAISTNFDITFADDFVVPETTDGIVALITETVKQKSINTVKTFLDNVPEVKSFYQHLALGGKPENYISTNIDYKSINVKTLDENSKIQLLTKSFELQGTPNKELILDLIKKAGEEELNQATSSAITFLDEKQTEHNISQTEELQAKLEEDKAKAEEYWGIVQTTIDQGKIGSINIPVSERKAFFDYMSKPINSNNDSKDYLDTEQDSLDFQLLVSYLRYKKGDIGKLVSNLARHENTQTLLQRFQTLKTLNITGVPDKNATSSNPSPTGLSLDSLLG